MFAYPATVQETREGDYLISFCDFPDLLAMGHSLSEAILHAEVILNAELRRLFFAHQVLPKPSKRQFSQIMIYLKRDTLMTWHELAPAKSGPLTPTEARMTSSRKRQKNEPNEFH
ncbi:MAG: type II toxin-antitoxin system HicB family antitoxin [Burkholderiaceae bacterium]|nr:type II toxin-antitoxin system HicB family antitoxin [Burkholderiaceae bacterium]